MKKEDLVKGTRIYYNGDMANDDGFGIIVSQQEDKWGVSVNIKMDDKRTFIGLSIGMFSDEYLGHGGTRFVTEKSFQKFKKEAYEKFIKVRAQRPRRKGCIE